MLTEQYRPYFVADLIGQDKAKKTVGSWLRTGRIPRCILLAGEFSAGKTTLARIIARTALCVEVKEGNACGKCRACVAFDNGTHQDYIEMNSASDRGIDAMRHVAAKMQMRPLLGQKRVLVLDEAHGITKPGWGAMLKPMEEPPQHVVIMVVTTNPEQIPATNLSRCSQVKLGNISHEECAELLLEVAKKTGLGKAGLKKSHLLKIAKVTHGHPRNALHALDQVYTMVLDAKEAGQTVDTAVVNGFIQDVAVADVETVAAAIVRGIVEGKPGGALKRAEDCWAQADLLLTKVTEMLRQGMLRSTNPKLMDPYYEEVFADRVIFGFTGANSPAHMEARMALLEAYSCFTSLRIQTSNYAVPVAEVIGEAIARSSMICQAFLKSQRPSGSSKTQDAA